MKSLPARVLISIGLCVCALLAGGAAFVGLASLRKPPVERPVVERRFNVEVFQVSQSRLQELITSYGTARPDREVVLAAEVAGRVIAVHPDLEEGHTVTPPVEKPVSPIDLGPDGKPEDRVLVHIDPATYEKRVAQVRNRLAETDAELAQLDQEKKNNTRMLAKVEKDYETAEADYLRTKGLGDRGVATPSDVNRALLDLRKYEDTRIRYENDSRLIPLKIAAAKQRKASLQTDLEVAQLDLSYTDVAAPFHAVVSELMVEHGQYVRAGDPLMRLTNIDHIEVALPLQMSDYARVEQLLLDGVKPDVMLSEAVQSPTRWRGKLVRIAPKADAQSRTIDVFVEVDNGKHRVPLLPGTFVHARIDGPVLSNATAMPREGISRGKIFVAIETKDDKGETVSRAEQRSVVIERTMQTMAIVTSGVKPGERVILTNLDVLFDGAAVNVQSQQTLTDVLNEERIPVVRELPPTTAARE